MPGFQARVQGWLVNCLGLIAAENRIQRNHRFLEESLELVQACGATAEECHRLVDYTFGRPVGDKAQEVGGVMLCLAALCTAHDLNMEHLAEKELMRVHGKIDEIRRKQATKPVSSPLPGTSE